MTLAEFCKMAPYIFFQIFQNMLMIKFHYISTRIKDVTKEGMLGPATLKIIHHRGTSEIGDYKCPKTKH